MNGTPSPPPRPCWVFLERSFWFATAVTLLVFAANLYSPVYPLRFLHDARVEPRFQPDSWTYLELSGSIFTDFYRYNTVRQFEDDSGYSSSHPPLWPVLIALARKAADLGIYTAFFLNIPVSLGQLAVLMSLFKKFGFECWVGAACYLCVLAFPGYYGDVVSGLPIPLSLLFMTTTVLLLVPQSATLASVALAGALMGLNCLTRFDALFAACLLGVAFAARGWQASRSPLRGAAALALYFVALLLVLSPWISYGMKHFGKPFASDSTRVALMAHGDLGAANYYATPHHYYETPPPADLYKDPMHWLRGLVAYKARVVVLGLLDACWDSALPALLAGVVLVWGCRGAPRWSTPQGRYSLLALCLLIPAMLLPALLVGWREVRYFTGTVLVLFVILYAALVAMTPAAWERRRVTAFVLLAAGLVAGELVLKPVKLEGQSLFALGGQAAPRSPAQQLPQMRAVTEAVHRDAGDAPHRLLVVSGFSVWQYGALTGEPTVMMPNLERAKRGTFAGFVRDWRVTHLYDPQNSLTNVFKIDTTGIQLSPLAIPGLYRVRAEARN
jgi:hypothetical protein